MTRRSFITTGLTALFAPYAGFKVLCGWKQGGKVTTAQDAKETSALDSKPLNLEGCLRDLQKQKAYKGEPIMRDGIYTDPCLRRWQEFSEWRRQMDSLLPTVKA